MTSRNLQNCFEYEYETEVVEDGEAGAEAVGRGNNYCLVLPVVHISGI